MPRHFRIALALLLWLAVAACGGGESVTNPPVDPVATSLAIAAGDNQAAATGTAVATAPSVLVKDQSGKAMAGVGVTFAVVAGGGSITGATTTTGSDGVARLGSWVLGQGANGLSATAASLQPVHFTATGTGGLTLSQATIPVSGGSLTISRPGHPADGLVITVPNGAYAGSTTWSVEQDATVSVPLKPGFLLAAPPLIVRNGQGYATKPVTLRMPLRVPATQALAPFFFDRASGTLEPIPLLARTDTSATLATRHFSASLMAKPRGSTVLTRMRATVASTVAATASFGEVVMVWVAVPMYDLIGTFTSGFAPGVDDWEFHNYGDFLSPGGICSGMSFTEMYYYYFVKPGTAKGLFHNFDQSVPNQWDNLQGMKFAASVQHDYGEAFESQTDGLTTLFEFAKSNSVDLGPLTEQWILLTLKLTGQPVAIGVHSPDAGHSVVAYSATSNGSRTEVSFADPNFTGHSRLMVFENGVFQPLDAALNAAYASTTFQWAYTVGVTADVTLSQLDTRWSEFSGGTSAPALYPTDYEFQVHNIFTNTWHPITGTIRSGNEDFTPLLICRQCPNQQDTPPGAGPAEIWDIGGQQPLLSGFGNILVPAGTTRYLLVGMANSPYEAGKFGLLDTKEITVQYAPMSLTPRNPSGVVTGTPVQFTLQNSGLAVTGSTFTWTASDGTSVTSGSNTFSHAFATAGSYTVNVRLTEPGGWVVYEDQTNVTVTVPAPAWRLTSATNVPGWEFSYTLGCSSANMQGITTMNTTMSRLESSPSDGMIYTGPWRQAGVRSKVYWQVAPAGMGSAATGAVAGWYHFLAGLTTSVGPTQFSADGVNVAGINENEQLLGTREWTIQIQASVSGTTITGSMLYQFSDGTGKCQSRRQYNFTGTLVAGIYP